MSEEEKFEPCQLYPSQERMAHAYEKASHVHRIIKEAKYDKELGAQVYYYGYLYPEKLLPYPEVAMMLDGAKKISMFFVYFFSYPPVAILLFPALLIPPLFKNIVIKAFGFFSHASARALLFFILKEENFCPGAKEIRRVGYKLGAGNNHYKDFIDFISMVFEYDDAYRYRIQDFFNEFDKPSFLANPRKEMKRMFKIVGEREQILQGKIKRVYYLFSLLFCFKFIRQPVMEYFKELDFDKVRMDEADAYWALFHGNYKYGGMEKAERYVLRRKIHIANGLKPL